MEHVLWITTDRVQHLIDGMPPGKIKVFDDEMDGTTKVSIEILHSTDLLYLFHAGIKHGMDAMKKYV
jgi:hypothetical protein